MQSTLFHPRTAGRILLKALALYLLVNLAFGLGRPAAESLGRLSLYNRLFPGRARLPYGEDFSKSYNLSLFNLPAMFASHELAGAPKSADEFRVILVGDSNTWGFLLQPGETLAAQINGLDLRLEDGRRVRAYNYGYPVMSLTKDLLLLSYAEQADPDLIIWLVTLESFPRDKQLFPPLLQNNPAQVQALIERYHLELDPHDPLFTQESFWSRTLIGQRRDLADLLRLQLSGVLWAATGIDQDIPTGYPPLQKDFAADASFHGLEPPAELEPSLAMDVLAAGVGIETPLLVVNEPIFISQGENSDIRYNFYYPRWAYDEYRRIMAEASNRLGFVYLDLWDLAPPAEFTNSAVHLSPAGARLLAGRLGQAILDRSP